MKSAVVIAALLLAASAIVVTPPRTYHMKLFREFDSNACTIISARYGQIHRGVRDDQHVVMKIQPQSEDDHEPVRAFGDIIELWGRHESVVHEFAAERTNCKSLVKQAVTETADLKNADEVIQIVNSGPADNRIDIVFMGDGYTQSERQRFIDDMRRLTDDMFASTTFASHLPLFNIWAVFRASTESGIGVGGKPKNTAFGLYRDGTELRGVYCNKPVAARQACAATGEDACDFPSLIGNDEFYGGLGGEFTISTRSLTSGTVVLRHELGHNLIDVGEEYDGGSAYFGANFASSVANVKWSHWLTNPSNLVAEQSILRAQDYAWYDLAKGPYTVRFNSDGQYARWLLKFSASGVETPGSLVVTLDGVKLNWNTTGNLDRGFHEFAGNKGFTSGAHTLTFAQGFPPEVNQIRQLCNLVLHEFKNETNFHTDREYIGAYPTWRQGGSLVGYRPNFEKCLMRNMTSVDFCVVCVEDMWLQLLARMSLIDSLSATQTISTTEIALDVVPLAQFRTGGPRKGELYTLTWTQNGVARPEYNNQFRFTLSTSSALGTWKATLKYTTPEIRADPRGYTTDTLSVTIS